MPNLIEVQKASYDQFLLVKDPPGGRSDEGLQAVFKSVFPIRDFSEHLAARLRRLRIRAAQVRRRRVPPARHDLCRAAQGDAAPDRVRCRRRDRRPLRQGHQGAGRLHGRHPAHDEQRHVHRQRHRARHRLADAPFARRVLRSRQGQDPFLGQAPVRRPHHSVSRLVARLRVRRQGHRPCAHRPPPQDSGDVAAVSRSASTARRSSTPSTSRSPYKRQKDGWRVPFDANRLQGYKADQRPRRRRHRQGRGRGRQEDHRASGPPARRKGPQGAAHDRRGTDRSLHRRGPGQREDRRDLRRGRRGDHREDAQARSTSRATRKSRSSTSTTSMSAPTSATRSRSTRT